MNRLNGLIDKPEWLFLIFATFFGLLFTFLIPPLGGNDEIDHYQRVAGLAYLQPLSTDNPVVVSRGVVDFIKLGNDTFYQQLKAPFNYSVSKWQQAYQISGMENNKALQQEHETVHHPFSYIPQIAAFQFGILLKLRPLVILYIVRLAGLTAAIALTFIAIRRIPSHKYLLCAITLLPTVALYRSFLSADTLADAIAFLFIACAFYEMSQGGNFLLKNMLFIIILAFVLAQCKSAYMFLLFLVCAIPGERFSSGRARITFLAITILPGIFASVAWMVIIKATYFKGIGYHTLGGNANPDMQVTFMLHNPIVFLKIFLQTLFLTPVVPLAFLGMTINVGPGYYLPFWSFIIILWLIILTGVSEKIYFVHYNKQLRLLAASIFIITIPIIFSMLYIQWTGVSASRIEGFQGRYLTPLLPLLLPFIKQPAKPLLQIKPGIWIMLLAFGGLTLSIWRITINYY